MLVVPSGLLLLLGLGLVVCAPPALLVGAVPAPPVAGPAGQGIQRFFAALALLLATGLLVDLTLLLALGKLGATAAAGVGLALIGLGLGGAVWQRNGWARPEPERGWLWLAPLLYMSVLLVAQLVADPVSNWDARSIWFFHAKILYYAEGLRADSGWAELGFSHPDYPKLLPALAAQVAHAAGYWNEYLPKLGLAFLVVPALLGLFAGVRRPLSAIFLGAFLFLRPYPLLWNGQADGFLALYCALATLALGRWIASGSRLDGALGAAFLGVACSLKNEGLYFTLCAGAAVAATLLGTRRRGPSAVDGRGAACVAGLTGLALLPLLLWRLDVRSWGLRPDLQLSAAYLSRAAERLLDGSSALQIAREFLGAHALAPLLLPALLAFAAAIALRAAPGRALCVPLLTALGYLAGLLATYLGTPNELGWHLDTSILRTPLPVVTTGAVAIFLLLEAIEAPPRPGAGRPAR